MKVRRIVAALHLHDPPGGRVAAIAELARRNQAELLGLFIEDIELLHFAALPFACEVGAASALGRSVDVAAMERFMRVRADELRTELADALAGEHVPWSFRVERGTLPRQALAAGIEQPGPTLLLPPQVDLDQKAQVVCFDELTEPRLRSLLQRRRPVLIVPSSPASGA